MRLQEIQLRKIAQSSSDFGDFLIIVKDIIATYFLSKTITYIYFYYFVIKILNNQYISNVYRQHLSPMSFASCHCRFLHFEITTYFSLFCVKGPFFHVLSLCYSENSISFRVNPEITIYLTTLSKKLQLVESWLGVEYRHIEPRISQSQAWCFAYCFGRVNDHYDVQAYTRRRWEMGGVLLGRDLLILFIYFFWGGVGVELSMTAMN